MTLKLNIGRFKTCQVSYTYYTSYICKISLTCIDECQVLFTLIYTYIAHSTLYSINCPGIQYNSIAESTSLVWHLFKATVRNYLSFQKRKKKRKKTSSSNETREF